MDKSFKLLSRNSANVNDRSGYYGTALLTADTKKPLRFYYTLELIFTGGGFSHDAFHAAAEGGHEGIVRLFLERGYGIAPKQPLMVHRHRVLQDHTKPSFVWRLHPVSRKRSVA